MFEFVLVFTILNKLVGEVGADVHVCEHSMQLIRELIATCLLQHTNA